MQDSSTLALKCINKYSINIPLWNENHVDGSGDFLHTNFGWCFEICLNFCECWESAEQPSAAQLGIQPKHSPHSPSREFQLIACHVLPSTTRNSNLVDTNFGGRNKARNSGCVFFTNQTTPISRSRWSKNRRLFCYTCAVFECSLMGLLFDESLILLGSQKADFGIFWKILVAKQSTKLRLCFFYQPNNTNFQV